VSADVSYMPFNSTRHDPEPRRDGKCVVCRGERPERAIKEGDPFCKTECARAWYRVGDPK